MLVDNLELLQNVKTDGTWPLKASQKASACALRARSSEDVARLACSTGYACFQDLHQRRQQQPGIATKTHHVTCAGSDLQVR